jgi:hypothetical protein
MNLGSAENGAFFGKQKQLIVSVETVSKTDLTRVSFPAFESPLPFKSFTLFQALLDI